MPVAIRPALVLDYTLPVPVVGASTVNVDYTATRPFVVADFHSVVVAQDANGATTVGLLRGSPGFVPILTALASNGAVGVVTRVTAGFVSTQYVIAAGDVVRCAFTSGAGGLDARAYAKVLPSLIAGTAPGFTGAANNATNLT